MPQYFIEQFPNHPCELKKEERVLAHVGNWEEIGSKLRNWLLISEENIKSHIYLRSKGAIELEKLRQIRSRYWCVIHPFSGFRHYWELWMSLVLLVSLFLLPLQSAFLNSFNARFKFFNGRSVDGIYLATLLVGILDVLWLLDVAGNFFTGYYVHSTKQVIMNPFRIVKNYFFGFFMIDFLGSVPVDFCIVFISGIEVYSGLSKNEFVFLQVFNVVKLVRIRSFVKYFYHSFEKYSSSHLMNRLVIIILVYCLINHWGACLCFSVPQMIYGDGLFNLTINESPYNSSWVHVKKILSKDLFQQYVFAVFHALMNIVGVGSTLKGLFNVEDQLVATVISVFGRFYWTWFLIIFLQVITTTYASRTKFFEILHQLKEYMMHKQLSTELQKRLIQFYRYRFQTHYFREKIILGSMSENLRKDITIFTCHKLIENTEIFHSLPKKAIENIVENLKCEIYLPSDTIIQAGTAGDCMYFVASGTAAAYTSFGKEICNFKDGDYFGELALILEDEKRTATVIATEVTELYKLDSYYFWQIVASHPQVFSAIEKNALDRYEATLRMDETFFDLSSRLKIKKGKTGRVQAVRSYTTDH